MVWFLLRVPGEKALPVDLVLKLLSSQSLVCDLSAFSHSFSVLYCFLSVTGNHCPIYYGRLERVGKLGCKKGSWKWVQVHPAWDWWGQAANGAISCTWWLGGGDWSGDGKETTLRDSSWAGSHTGGAWAAGRGALESAGAAGDEWASKLPSEAGRKAPGKVRSASSIYPRRKTAVFVLKRLCVLVQFGLVTGGLDCSSRGRGDHEPGCWGVPRYRGQETAPCFFFFIAESGILRLNPRAEVLIGGPRWGTAREEKGA